MLDVFECKMPSRLHADGSTDKITLHDCQTCSWRPRERTTVPRALLLKNHLSPGDVLAMTAAVRSLHMAHPGKYLIRTDTTCPAVWEHSPDMATDMELSQAPPIEEVTTHYPLVNECNQRAVHFMQGYCDFLEQALQVKVPLMVNRPRLWLSNEEKEWQNQVEQEFGTKQKFWLIVAGTKQDYTAKGYGHEGYQEIINLLRGKILFVQVGKLEHCHKPLRGVLNLLGKTDDRQLIRLAWHAQGGLGGVTFLQHIMAALQKPYVCLMGGREPVQWNSYPTQQLLHTVGLLPCCKDGGCWKSRVAALGDGSEQDKSLCEQPFPGEEPVPRCMELIRPSYVAETILRCAWHGATGG